jgi:hypothetical protein
MTVVNPQITDVVSSSASVREAIEHALVKAAADAVAAQQQFYVLAQAATTQSVATMLSIDSSATAVQVKADLHNLHDAAAAVKSHAPNAGDEIAPSHGEVVRGSGVAPEMNALGEVYCRNLMRVVQIAATSACTTAMIARPEKFDTYLPILEAIKKFV